MLHASIILVLALIACVLTFWRWWTISYDIKWLKQELKKHYAFFDASIARLEEHRGRIEQDITAQQQQLNAIAEKSARTPAGPKPISPYDAAAGARIRKQRPKK